MGGAGGEGGVLDPLLQLRHPALLKFEVRDDALESGLRQQGEVGRRVAEVLIKTSGEGAQHEVVKDLSADVAKLVGEHLEPHAVLVDGGVVLMTAEELLLQENKALKFVVGEERVDLGPHGAGVVVLGDNRVEDVLRDRLVEPSDDRDLNGGPLRIATHVRTCYPRNHRYAR